MTESAESTPALNIFQRLNAVRLEVDYVKKDAVIDGKYQAVTHDQVTAVVRKSLIKHGIMVSPSLLRWTELETPEREGKAKNRLFAFDIAVSFINIDSPTDVHSVVMPAHGMDTGDKAPGKAMSLATKNAILKVLSLETGVNEESRAGEMVDDDLVATAMVLITDAENMEELHAGFNSAAKLVRNDPGALKTLIRVKDSRKKAIDAKSKNGGDA